MSTILITGASTGIGENIAHSLAHKGHKVYAGVRSRKDFDKYKEVGHEKLIPVILDVTNDAHIDEVYEQIENASDKVDILINNAGIVVASPMESLSLERMRFQMEVNFFGPFRLIKKFLPDLKERKGRIINIGSTSGLVAWPFNSAYTASKFALDGWGQALRVELFCVGVKVITVAPGAVKTPIWNKATDDFNKTVEDHPDYRTGLLGTKRLIDKGVKKAVHPMAVTMKVVAAIRAENPKELYLVGPSAYMQYYMAKVLPRNFFAWLKTKLCRCY
jgi:short-subunit dehydrogenase